MNKKVYDLKVNFVTEILGSQGSVDVMSNYVAKAKGLELADDELELLPEALDRGTTVFHRDEEEKEYLLDYQLKGFLKESGRVQNGKVTGGVKNLRSKVASLVFVEPRLLYLISGNGGTNYLERPIRGMTAKGERIALARSEMLPAGTFFYATLVVLEGEISEAVLRDLLDYGVYQGIGQWRGGGYGRFKYELSRAED